MSLTPPLVSSLPPLLPSQTRSLPHSLGPRPRTWVAGILIIAVVLLAGIGRFAAGKTSSHPLSIAQVDPDLVATLQGMQLSATLGDWDGFSRYVDVPAFRSSLLTAAQRDLAASRAKGETDIVESALGGLLMGVLLEKYVTDQTLPMIMRMVALGISVTEDGTRQAGDLKRSGYFVGREIFVLAGENAKENRNSYLVLRKSAARGWKLVGVTDQKPQTVNSSGWPTTETAR